MIGILIVAAVGIIAAVVVVASKSAGSYQID